MAGNRLRIQKQLERSATPGSLVRTDGNNEQEYFAPGADGTVLTIIAGVPTFATAAVQAFTLTDGTTSEVIGDGDTLLIQSGNGISAVVSATDVLTLALRLSTDTGQSLSIGSDGGLFYDSPDVLTGASWDDTTNSLVLSFTEGSNVSVPIVDLVGAFIADFTISDGTNTDIVNNHETLVFAGTNGLQPMVSANQVSYSLRIQEDVFTALTTGSTITLTQTPLQIFTLNRNGLDQIVGGGEDYTISGTTVTFNVGFGVSGGAVGGEDVRILYTY